MRPFRGNCQQVAIMEGQLIASGKAWKVDDIDNLPLFKEQNTFQSKIVTSRYWVRTDNNNKFIPEIYGCTFRYNITDNKGEVHMDRKVVDVMLQLIPEALKSQIMNQVEDNSKEIPIK